MNELANLAVPTMTSLELVKLINDLRAEGQAELRHTDFTAKIRKVVGDEGAKFSAPLKTESGQTAQGYILPKRECHLMVMSESYKVQAAVYDRMVELESAAPKLSQVKDPRTAALIEALVKADRAEQTALEAKSLAEQSLTAANENRHETAKNTRRLDQIETAVDHFTVLGYMRHVKGESIPLAEAASIGKKASHYCKQHEVPMGEVPDPRFGRVKTYPKWVLDNITKTVN